MKIALVSFLFVASTFVATAQTTIAGGTINKDSVWTLAGSPYIVTATPSLNTGFTLTVDSGVVVRFQGNTGLYILGTLKARQATFTSAKDTAGGTAAKGDWNWIQVGDGSNQAQATLDTCHVRYGGFSSPSYDYSTLLVYSGKMTLTGTDISLSKNSGIRLGGSTANDTAVVRGCNITACDWPFTYRGVGALIFDGSNIYNTGNTHNGINTYFYQTNANMYLDTANVPYVFQYGFLVTTGTKLEIASGNILKFSNGISMSVDGTLIANAAPGQEIDFTAYTNDNLGGDTNADGTTSAPSASYWYGVSFHDISIDSASIMRRCKVTFAGYGQIGGISMYNAGPTIDSCSMANNYYGVMMQGTSSPVFTNNDIGTSSVVPIALSFSANPTFSNNTFSASDNQYDAIGILSETVVASSYLPIRSVTSIPNVTYLLLGTVTIPANDSLTIQPGIVIKSYGYYNRLVIQGKLIAQGTVDSTIVFTSVHDDQYGNPHDTNKNGNITNPARGDWGGITFESSNDTASVLSYCVLRYGNTPGSYYGTYPNGQYTQGLVTLINTKITMDHDTLTDNVFGVYAFLVSNPSITNCIFINSQYTPVAMSVSANPTFSSNSMQNPGLRALGIIGHGVSANGTIYRRNFAGYTNITYVVLGDVTINSGTTVNVDPGVVIKMNSGTNFYVSGGFTAKGTQAGGLITFTSIKDDNVGNPLDTNGDGLSTAPARGDWGTIAFYDASIDSVCLLDSTVIQYGGNSNNGLVTFVNASGTVSNSTLAQSNYYGVRCDGNSAPLVTGVAFQSSRLDPIAMSLLSNPTFTNVTFSANGTSGIRIIDATLSSNATLNRRDVAGITNIAYIIDNLIIAPSATLTIAPGVVLKFTSYYNGIDVQGGLKAQGTQSEKIYFTSLSDDSNGGDTNNDGNSSSGAKGNWRSVDFANSSLDSVNTLRNCVFRYGGGYNYSYEYGMVRFYSAKAVIDSCVFTLSAASGIGIFGSADPMISNSEITAVNYTPVTMSMFANPTFSNNTFLNVGYAGIGIIPETYSQNATIPLRDLGGYTNITYVLWGYSTVNSGTVISIPAGAVFKDYGFVVNGSLKVLGSSGNPVVFTNDRDDNYGNPMDTNGDGSATSPSVEASYRLYYSDQSVDTADVIQYGIFRYATYGIDLQQAAPTVSHCTFSKNTWGVQLNGVSNPTIDNCTFDNLTTAPIQMSLAADFNPTGTNVISGTTYRALGVVNETLAGDATMTKRNFAGFNNIPYLMNGLTVGTSSTLTIQPGVILKFQPYSNLTIDRGLLALGGAHPDSTIVFTSYKDDFYGGDTNADSTATSPTFNDWGAIIFDDLSYDPDCRIEHAVIRYGGYYYGGAVRTTNASPTLKFVSLRDNYKGLVASGSSSPVINYSDIYKNSDYGIENVNKSFTIDARWNWWGNNSGPTHAGNPGGTGSTVTDSVNYSSFLVTGTDRPLAGDVSLSGGIQAYDASLILKYLADNVANPLNPLQQQVADVSAAGGISALDASYILQYVVGKISIFPIEFNRSMQGQTAPQVPQAEGVIALSGGSVDHGKTITLAVTGEGLKNLFGAGMQISYDPALLSFTSISAAGLAEGKALEYSASNGKLRIFFASANAIEGSGSLLTLTFAAAGDLRGRQDVPVNFTELTLNEQNALSRAVNASISVKGKPVSFALNQNYPNPFNPSTTIAYQVPNDGDHVLIEIYNLTGQVVQTLVDKDHAAGEYTITWDGRSSNGIRVSSGLYFYRMKAGSFVSVKKMIMVK